jgi:hypothetical protein
MALNQITSQQIKNEDLTTEDIKNGTILLEDLHADLQALIGGNSDPGGTGIVDPFHHYIDKYTVEMTTGNTWQTYLQITTSALADGLYRLATSYTYRVQDSNALAEFRFVLDGTQIISLQRLKEKSSSAELILASDFAVKRLTGVHTLQLQYRADTANRIAVYLYEGKLELMRVAP